MRCIYVSPTRFLFRKVFFPFNILARTRPSHYEEALDIQLKAHNPEHEKVGSVYFSLSETYYNNKDKTKAMAYLLKAKAIYLKKLGAQHPQMKSLQGWIDDINEECPPRSSS